MLNLNLEYVRARTMYVTSGILVVLLFCAGGAAGYLYVQNDALTVAAQEHDAKLSKQDGKLRELQAKIDKYTGVDSKMQSLIDGNNDMEEKVRAFAKQAASCEAIKQKYHFN